MFCWIFTLLYYSVLILIAFLVGGFVFFGIRQLKVNDFPNKRKYCTSTVQLNGKTVIVTGGYSNIGFETAKEFAKRGARVVLPYRTETSAAAARDKIIAETGNKDVELMKCDLSDLESIKNFCQTFIERESNLHILVNNAVSYGLSKNQPKTKQSFNVVVGVNYVGHFLLTYLLLDLLKQSAPSRIINVSSIANYSAKEVDLTPKDDNGNLLPNLEGYRTSKLLNILHTKYLARILQGTSVTVNAVHPGFILGDVTRFIEEPKMRILATIFQLYKPLSLTPHQGAQTTLYCALDESLNTVSGKYYDNCKEKGPNKLAEDSDLARRVWDLTLQLVREI